MNATTIQALLAGLLSLGQLVAGVVLLAIGRNDPELRGLGLGFLIGGTATGAAGGMRTRGGTGTTTALALVCGLAMLSTSACGAITGAVKQVAPAERDRAIAQMVAYDFEVQEVQLAHGCDEAREGITGYRAERDALLGGIETVYAGKCSSRATGVLDAIRAALKIAAEVRGLGGVLGQVAHVIVGAIADGITPDDCDAFARLHMEIALSDDQANVALADLCAETSRAVWPGDTQRAGIGGVAPIEGESPG